MSDTPENTSLPQPGPDSQDECTTLQSGTSPQEGFTHPPGVDRTLPLPSSGRILLCYFLAVLLLALLQAPRLADTLEEFAGEAPQAEELAKALRGIGEHSGLNALGEKTAALFSRLSPPIYLGAVDKADGEAEDTSSHVADSGPDAVYSGKPDDSADHAPLKISMGDTPPATLHSNGTAMALPQANATAALNTPALQDTGGAGKSPLAAGLSSSNGTALENIPAANAAVPASSAQRGGSTNSSALVAATTQNATVRALPATNATASATAGNATAADDSPFESDKPLVLLIGDSMMMEGLGPALLRSLRTREDIVVIREAKYSTGLSRKDYFDWPAHMESLVEKYKPAVVIITMGGNDAQDIVDDSKKRHFVATDSWGEQYKERASLLIQAAQKEGATVIWVGLPVMGQPTHAKRSLQLCVQQEAACVDNSPCVYVDTLELLTDSKGEFTAFVKDSDGKQVRIRYKDKIHVTTAGGEILIKAVLPELDKLLEAITAGDESDANDGNAAAGNSPANSTRVSGK